MPGGGQSHKVRIIELWLDRQGFDQIARRVHHSLLGAGIGFIADLGFDQIARWVHHSPQSIKRYVSAFLRIVVLHQQGMAEEEIAFVTRSSPRLVQDYLALYQAALAVRHRREKLQEELARLTTRREAPREAEKGGARDEPGEPLCQHREAHA